MEDGTVVDFGVFSGGALALNQVTKSPYVRASENIDQAYGALDEHRMFAPESQKAMEQTRRSSDKAQQWENKRAARDIRSDGMKPGAEFTQTELNLRNLLNQEQTADSVPDSRTGMDQSLEQGWRPEEQDAAPDLEEGQKKTAPEREAVKAIQLNLTKNS